MPSAQVRDQRRHRFERRRIEIGLAAFEGTSFSHLLPLSKWIGSFISPGVINGPPASAEAMRCISSSDLPLVVMPPPTSRAIIAASISFNA